MLYQNIDLPKIIDERGNLSFFEQNNHIPFEIKRIYWIYDVPGGEKRGGHAYKNLYEFIVALSGSFELYLNNGREEKTIQLNRSYTGILVPKMVWRELSEFSTNALCLISANDFYSADEYIRSFEEFKTMVK